MKTIKTHIAEMLKEDTGSHFLDSGGNYGRNWQRNQIKDLESEDRVSWDIYGNEITETVSVFHYLTEVLAVDIVSERITNKIKKLGLHWTGEVRENIEDNNNIFTGHKIEFFGDSCNTYNGENNLSQVLQFQIIKINDEPYVILQIHGGCDVRGGYTRARCFKLLGYLTGQVNVIGTIDGVEVTNGYNGYSITDERGNEVELTDTSEISLDFYVIDDVYMYE